MTKRTRQMGMLVGGLGLVGLLLAAWQGGAMYSQGPTANVKTPGPTPLPASFDKNRAMNYLRAVCALGPRPSGSTGMAKQIELLTKHFEQHGLTVEKQTFQAKQRSQPQPVEMTNLIARWKPEAKRRLLLCAHYDTRPHADEEPNPRDWEKPFVGANDGGSGVAMMMELAHHLKEIDPQIGVDFVLFDGEEFIFSRLPSDQGGDKYFFGSEYFGGQYLKRQREEKDAPRYVEAILLDMVAGKTSRFRLEEYSRMRGGPLLEKIWKIAAEVGSDRFVPQYGIGVLDDHLALQNAGIMAIDIVPCKPQGQNFRAGEFLDYPHWHKLSDVPENCSPDTLEQVARVLMVWLKRAQ